MARKDRRVDGTLEQREDLPEQQGAQASSAAARLPDNLEAARVLYAAVLESIPVSVVVVDGILRIVSVNRNFLDKARRDVRETIGRTIDDVFPSVLVEYTRLTEKIREVFRTGGPAEGKRLAYHAPGLPLRLYFYRLVPLVIQGAVENVMLLLDDVTEREQLREEYQRAERHLASVVECANDVIVSLDAEGRVRTWNKTAETITGIAPDLAIGNRLTDLCAGMHRRGMADLIAAARQGRQVHDVRLSLVTAEGAEIPVAWNSAPMRDDTGTVVGIVALGRDLRERIALEAQLMQSAKMASLGVMAGGIAHQIRNPLAVASGAAQLLLERPGDDALRAEALPRIYESIGHASLIIENLLKFARPLQTRKARVDINALLGEVCTRLGEQIRLRKVTVRMDVERFLPAAQGNRNLLEQVFANLVLNACQAMPEGGTLIISTRTDETGKIEVSFADTGVGIPSEHLSRVFEPFFSTFNGGTGLGLSISYKIIEQHGGTIEVTSEPGKGTTFVVRLPSVP